MKKQELKSKDIDLLNAYRKSSEVSMYAPWMNYVIPPLVMSLIVGGVYGFLSFRNHQIQSEITSANAEIVKIQGEIANDAGTTTYAEIQELISSANTYEAIYDKIATYPNLAMSTFNAIYTSTYGISEVIALSYARENQIVTLTIESSFYDGTEIFVRRLKDTAEFESVTYTGYNRVEKSSVATDTPSELSSEELLEYLKNNASTSTYNMYTATVLCTLK